MKKFGIAVLLVIASSVSAAALSRYESTQLSCARIQSILNQDGSAILRYPSARNPGIVLYDTYAAQSGQCTLGGRGELATVPASDTKSCRVVKCVNKKGGGR